MHLEIFDVATPTNLADSLVHRWRRFDSWLARKAWCPTAEGIVWVILSLFIMVQGWLRGFNLITFVASFLISMWALNALTTLFMGRRLSKLRGIRKFLGPAYVGQATPISLELENRGAQPVAGLLVEDRGTNHLLSYGFPLLQVDGQFEALAQIRPEQRGRYQWQPLQASSAYPFGLFRRTVKLLPREKPGVVLPVVGKLDVHQFQRWLRSAQRIANTLTRERPRRAVSPADFYGIREYRPGDSPRLIHWRTTARVGEPMVREFEEPPQQHVTIILEAWLPETEEALKKQWRQIRLENVKTIRMLYRMLGAPTPQQREAKEAQLAKKENPFRQPLDHVEWAVSLAATLVWTWTRKLGSNLTLGVVDDVKDMNAVYESGPALRTVMLMMERLALSSASTNPPTEKLAHELSGRKIPKGPIVLISPHTSDLYIHLTQILGRPVQLLDVSQPAVQRFFTTEAKARLKE